MELSYYARMSAFEFFGILLASLRSRRKLDRKLGARERGRAASLAQISEISALFRQ